MPDATTPDAIDAFITRWQSSGAAERSNYALFLSELCDLLPATGPDPSELAACFGKRTHQWGHPLGQGVN